MIVDGATFRRLCRARDLIHDRSDDALSLDELADAAGLSRFHFLRQFRRAYGKTPLAYLQEVRLKRARDLLGRGTSVTEACVSVGFSSVGSFSALFAKKMGMSPSQYQREVRRLIQIPDDLPLIVIPYCFIARVATSEQS
jgi:AraC-like DNA-binding protein